MPAGKGPLRTAIEDFVETYLLGGIIREAVKKGIEEYEKDLIGVNHELFSFLLNNPDLPPEIKTVLKKNFSGSSQGSVIGIIMAVLGAVISIALGAMGPVSRTGEYFIDKKMRTARMNPSEGLQAARYFPQGKQLIYDGLRELGWHDELIIAWEKLLEPRVAESDILRLYHRYPTFRPNAVSELKRRGWSDAFIDQLVKASMVTPGLQDLVTFAVREVYDSQQRAALGLDADFPQAFADKAALIGVDPEYARDYWASHWQLPSLQMGFDMLHRLRPGRHPNPVTIPVIKDLIKAQDYAHVWRDRLIAISYSPLTRVDIRRIYQIGQMTKDEVYEAYLDLGYDEVNARRLTDFATLTTETSGKDLTRATIESAYQKGIISYDVAFDELVDMGYAPEEIEILLAIKDYQNDLKIETGQIDVIQLKFMIGELDELGARNELNALNLAPEYVNNIMEELRVKKAKQIKVPTKAELEDLYEENIIDFNTMADQMRKRGYAPETANWLIALIDVKVQRKKAKELKDAQEEEERVLKAEQSNQYQKDKAAKDVEVAEWQAYIADLKLTAHFIEDAAQLDLISQEIDGAKLEIANVNLEKAQLRSDFLTSEE